MKTFRSFILLALVSALPGSPRAQSEPAKGSSFAASLGLSGELMRGLELRNIGPAFSPGRVADIAVDPRNASVWYVATASSGLWKTRNRGDTWEPIFDHGGSYSMGCVALDPNHPNTVWLGTGENQALRSVSFGDGLYKSTDGGETWLHVGLSRSEHIGKIFVDPRDSDVVYVASQGPLWSPGGDRGLYKTSDGGKTWKPVLQISENTGITDMAFDPRNSDVIYAASYQRRRNVGLLIGGGPEAGIFKSEDGGDSWHKLTNGIPSVDLGRIALAISPQDPDVVYALIVAAGRESGFFRSADRGETWVRRSNYRVVDPQYYGEIYCDPHKFDRVYAMDVTIHVTEDGGKTFERVPWRIHVDNHAIVFDPTDANHLLVGNDGGLYETYDGGTNWQHFVNMPTMQFYRVAVDNAAPFYDVYGGAQDNGTVGGPARTPDRVGIRNSDWIAVGGADGMQPRVDPEDPDIVYSMSQNGSLTRLDKRTGETVNIRPRSNRSGARLEGSRRGERVSNPTNRPPASLQRSNADTGSDSASATTAASADSTNQTAFVRAGNQGESVSTNAPEALQEEPVRWNWDAPFIISPHSHTRLYLAGSRLFRSDDRGDHWTEISPDLTRQIDRDTIPVMGRLWSSNAVTKNLFTTDFGVASALAESPLQEGLLYVGTDDGLVQVSGDGGGHWRKIGQFPGVPDMTSVSDLCASSHDTNTVYAAFNDYQRGDFKPYLLRSDDRGRTWVSIVGDLPDRHFVWCVVEDPAKANLLFAGTEFGLFFTVDGGGHWIPLSGGMPTAAIRDIEIQKAETDLVCASFGRGIFVLDDYTPLRFLTPDVLDREATLFPLRRAYVYPEISYTRAAWGNYVMPNPEFGAAFTYFLRDVATNDDSRLYLAVTDASGREVRRLNAPVQAGLHRVYWDLRGAARNSANYRGSSADQPRQWAAEEEEEEDEMDAPQSADSRELRQQAGSQQSAPPERGRRGRGFRGRRGPPRGDLVKPGRYTVTLIGSANGLTTTFGKPQAFDVLPLAANGVSHPNRIEDGR